MVSTATQGWPSQPAHRVVGLQRLAEQRNDEPRRERQQRDGGDTLHPPVADALAGGAAAETLAKRSAQAHGVTPRRESERAASEPHGHRGQHQRRHDDDRATAARLRALEPAARIPDEVPDAVAEVIDERKREADEQ